MATHENTAPAHTPGPWRTDWLGDDRGWILDEQSNYLAEIVTADEMGFVVSKGEQEANARLIALSPEMADALLEAFSLYRTEIDREDDDINGDNFLDAFLYWRSGHEHLLNRLEGRP